MMDMPDTASMELHMDDRIEDDEAAAVTHVVIEVSLPDRPGALGAVASRIGAVGGDITDVRVASRAKGFVDDVFHVDLPVPTAGLDMVGLVLEEIAHVDGVTAPSISHRPDSSCCRPAEDA